MCTVNYLVALSDLWPLRIRVNPERLKTKEELNPF